MLYGLQKLDSAKQTDVQRFGQNQRSILFGHSLNLSLHIDALQMIYTVHVWKPRTLSKKKQFQQRCRRWTFLLFFARNCIDCKEIVDKITQRLKLEMTGGTQEGSKEAVQQTQHKKGGGEWNFVSILQKLHDFLLTHKQMAGGPKEVIRAGAK